MPLFLVRVKPKTEISVARRLFGLREGRGVYAIYVPPEATAAMYDRYARPKGYIIVEAEDEGKVYSLMETLIGVKRRLVGEISEEELREYVSPRAPISVGDFVRIISGPFAGSTGVVEKINEAKNTVVIRLSEEIPVIDQIEVPITHVRKLEEGEIGRGRF